MTEFSVSNIFFRGGSDKSRNFFEAYFYVNGKTFKCSQVHEDLPPWLSTEPKSNKKMTVENIRKLE